jgi:hypothetical protein
MGQLYSIFQIERISFIRTGIIGKNETIELLRWPCCAKAIS